MVIKFDAAIEEEAQEGLQVILDRKSDMSIEVAKKCFPLGMAANAEEWLKAITSLKIATDTENETATFIGVSSSQMVKTIDDVRKQIIDKPDKFVREINAYTKIFKDKFENVKNLAGQKTGQYRAVKEQQRREAESAALKAQQELQKKLNEEAKEKNVEPVVIETPVLTPAKTITRTEAGSSFSKTVMTFKLVNLAQVPEEYKETILKEGAIKQAIKDGLRDIPGLEIFPETKTQFRTI